MSDASDKAIVALDAARRVGWAKYYAEKEENEALKAELDEQATRRPRAHASDGPVTAGTWRFLPGPGWIRDVRATNGETYQTPRWTADP